MGDGRYYTIYQFSLSLIFIILAVLTVSFMMISYYKNKNKETSKYISVSLLLLLFCIITAFVENVVGNLNYGFFLRYISKLCLIACLSILTDYLFSYASAVNKIRIREVIIVVSGVCVATFFSKGNLLIANYEFWKTRYSLFYILILCALFLCILLSIYRILKSKTILHSLYSNKKLAVAFTVLYLVPIGMYICFIISGYKYLDFIECSLYFIIMFFINIATTTEQSFGLTSKQFEELSDMLEDYVFVIDNKGNIVYKNDVFENSRIFNNTNVVVDINNIKLLFFHNVKIVNSHFGNNYIQLETEGKTKYFSYKNKELKDEERLLGYMVTITDITHILDLVNKLETNNSKYIETNKQLSNYSNVVYKLEKEINILLEEIITTREKSMDDLILMIDELENNIDNNEFHLKLIKAIRLNIDILNEVRHAVTAYREHYGGKY